MTRNEAVVLVKQYLGFKQNLDTSIVTTMQSQQTKLELMPVKPWFLLSEQSYSYTVAEQRRVRIPTDFLEEYEEGCLWYVPDDTTLDAEPMKKDFYDVLYKNYMGEDSEGPPEAYSLDGEYFNIFPLPDDVYRLEMKYYKKADLLDAGGVENAWLKYVPELLIGKTGLAIANSLRNTQAASIFKEMISENMLLLNAQNEARKASNFDMQMGGQH